MKASDFIAQLNKAVNAETLYVSGAWGIELRSGNSRVDTLFKQYKRNREHKAEIDAVMDKGYFGDDCVCLLKSIFWGWDAKYPTSGGAGGAKYASNGVPDCTEDYMIQVCDDLSTDFTNIIPAELVWTDGHIGCYIGNGLVIECTPQWDNCVQITGLANVGKTFNNKTRTWKKHGKSPWIDYSEYLQPQGNDVEIDKGIDISRWQEGFDLNSAKLQGFNTVILRAGYADGGYGKDYMFDQFYEDAKNGGWRIGAYYFGCAFSVEDAKKEANYFIQYLQGKEIKKVYYDVEAKMLNQGKQHLTDIIKAFCDTLNNAGYICGVYTSESHFNSCMYDEQLRNYPHWVAKYSKTPPILKSNNAVEIWQYGGSTNYIRTPQIDGRVIDQDFIYDWSEGDVTVIDMGFSGKSIHEIALEIVDKKMYGIGEDRKNILGSLYNDVQNEVNRICAERASATTDKSIDQLANEVLADMWGKNPTRAIKLTLAGYDAKAVQKRVNEICTERKAKEKIYVVQPGDTLTKIAKKYGTTVERLMEVNVIPNKNLIYVGQTLTIA